MRSRVMERLRGDEVPYVMSRLHQRAEGWRWILQNLSQPSADASPPSELPLYLHQKTTSIRTARLSLLGLAVQSKS